MSRIRAKDTKPEMIVRHFLHAIGYRYRLHSKKIPGTPDIVLQKYNVIIDIRGCFWHSHKNCLKGALVKTDSQRISANRKTATTRDDRNLKIWKELGWNVIVIWADCELEPKRSQSKIREKTLQSLIIKLKEIENSGN